jgi:hypothetical protein
VVEGDVLPLKPFLDPTPPTIQPWLSPLGLSLSEMAAGPRLWQCCHMETAGLRDAFSSCQTCRSSRWPGRGCTAGEVGSRNGFGSRTSSSTTRPWKISSCLNKFGNYVEK